MIQIKKVADELSARLSNEGVRHKIIIRINFSLDVYIESDELTEQDVDEMFSKDFGQYSISYEVHTCDEVARDRYLRKMFEQSGVSSGERFRLNSLLDIKPAEQKIVNRATLPPIVTFYSYKGGMGRTTTMVSYAIHLALQGKRVFVIDADLEAPGYLNFFNLSEHESLNGGKVNGLVEYLSDLQFSAKMSTDDKTQLDLQQYCLNIKDGNHAMGRDERLSNIYLMPAGNLNGAIVDDVSGDDTQWSADRHRRDYVEGLSRLNLASNWTILQCFNTLLTQVKSKLDPDVILIDSRTGFNDVMGTTISFLSDAIVGFFGSSQQTVPGLKQILDSYRDGDFSLLLINSILPPVEQEEKATAIYSRFREMMDEYYRENDVSRDRPTECALHRYDMLEQLGVDDNLGLTYLEAIKNGSIPDYYQIFGCIDTMLSDLLQGGDKAEFLSSHRPKELLTDHSGKMNYEKEASLNLRNYILRGLKEEFGKVTVFAEDQSLDPKTFFYRYWMNMFFEENKFLIMGHKGTGKTYLYRALAESGSEIAEVIKKRANNYRSVRNLPPLDNWRYKFVDIISATPYGKKRFAFENIAFDRIDTPELYFKRLWQWHTWISILLDEEFAEIRAESALSSQVHDDFTEDAGLKMFNDILDQGVDAFIAIQSDMRKIDAWCASHQVKLFLLYDQLDTRINPRYWHLAVSPLINYWRENFASFTHVLPKIFVRTDLFHRIGGTNTARLSANIIDIEWSIDEIFGYLIKIIFCNEERAKRFYEILSRIYDYRDSAAVMIDQYKREFEENDNQLAKLNQASLGPFIRVIFGKEVTVKHRGRLLNLGSPYSYFAWNLANADRRSYSLRPFILTLDRNAIEASLGVIVPQKYVTSLIDPEVYANSDVRNRAAQVYFEDLTKDTFSQDLIKFRDVLQSDAGKPYRFKTLLESDFNALIQIVMDKYSSLFSTVSTSEDLKLMLYASGIVAEKHIAGGKIYRFAPLYYYIWALKSTKHESTRDNWFDED